MKVEKQEDEEIESLLGQIPLATSVAFHHYECDSHQRHGQGHGHVQAGHGHVQGGHGHVYSGLVHGDGSQHKHTIPQYIMYDDKLHSWRHGYAAHGRGDTTNQHAIHHRHGIYEDDPLCHGGVCVSPVTPSDGSSSSFFSGGLSPDEEGSPLGPLNDFSLKLPTRTTNSSNRFYCSPESDSSDSKKAIDEAGLSDKFQAMGILDKGVEHSPLDAYATLLGANRVNVASNGSVEDYWKDYPSLYSQSRSVPNFAISDEERRSDVERRLLMLRLQQHYQMGTLPGSHRPDHSAMNFSWKPKEEHNTGTLSFRPSTGTGIGGTQYPSAETPESTLYGCGPYSYTDDYFRSLQSGLDSRGRGLFGSSSSSSVLRHPKPSMGIDSSRSLLDYGLYSYPSGWSSQSRPPVQLPGNLCGYDCEGSFILQGGDDIMERHRRGFPCYGEMGNSVSKKFELNSGVPVLPANFNSLAESQGCIYFMAKDQHGCRFLQRKFDEGTLRDVQIIFDEIIDHVVELMMNPFGNYLIQKLLEVCNEDQRMQILLVVTRAPGELVNISLNTHGTRAVQKLIETLKTREQISLVVSALESGFLDLIKDLNGNHVVQRCLQCLSSEDNKFIFYAAAKYCVDIATQRHGCCVLQRCIAHSTGEHREKLVSEISLNGLLLAQDAFGNYVVQYILEMKIPSATATLVSQFEGNYVHLAQQKFSSNVVEKCLQTFGEENRSRIIHELLSTSQFDKLLQDPFANYVIQCALAVSKGYLHASLVEAIRPHAAILRTNPHCKRIISRALLKK
ncbi:putative pumilio homolog 8, chloroplastic [Aristolochia californica]|uniref:putative pumilio homolog 8, chloroplastic n=1 Tax=Aristolochia californica TaxID=171875 RepID=UPI0035E0BDB9